MSSVRRVRGRTALSKARFAVALMGALLSVPFVPTTASATDPIIDPPSLPCFVFFGQPGWLPPPDATDDSYTRENLDKSDPGDTTFLSLTIPAPGVLGNDGSGDWHAALYTAPSHAAQFQLNPDGSFHYVPVAGYFGADSFTYVRYVTGGECSTGATVTIDAATHIRAQDDSYTAYTDTTLSQDIPICDFVGVCEALNNDVNTDGNTRVLRTYRKEVSACCITYFPTDPGTPAPTQHGTATVFANGSFTYTPQAGYTGHDEIWYQTVNTATGVTGYAVHCLATCDKRYAIINIDVTNPPPPTVAQGVNDTVSVDEDTTTTINADTLLANDLNAFKIVYVQNSVFPYDTLRTDHGSVTMHYTDLIPGFPSKYVSSIDYTPDANYNGPDAFRYYPATGYNNGWDVSDYTGTVEITVDPVSDPPHAATDSGATGFNQAVTIDVVANDTDPEANIDPTTLGRDPDPCNNEPQRVPSCDRDDPSGWLALAHGAWQPHDDGTITYTPTTGFIGTAVYPYQVCDTTALCDQATVAVVVSSVHDDAYDTTEDTPLTVDAPGVLGNDRAGVTATLGTTTQHGTLSLHADGSFSYTPAANFNGSDSFTYTIGTAETAHVTIDVGAVNDAPNLFLNGFCDHSIPGVVCLYNTDVRDIVEGGTAELNGSITDPEFDAGTMTIHWGDGATTTADYPCSGEDCPFTSTPTYSSLCIGSCGDPIYFHLTHVYTDDPSGSSNYYSITGSAVEADDTTGTQAASARVVNVDPDLTVSPEQCDLCIGSYSHLAVNSGEQASVAGRIVDPGTDTGTLTIDWGDGTTPSTVSTGCGSPSDLCPTPSQQALGCGFPGTFGLACGYFDVPHTYVSGGSYTVRLTATDDDGGSDSAQATATINGPVIDTAPTITSASTATFSVGSAGTFTVTTAGHPTPALSESGTLPSGVTFTDNGDGTATVAGTPAAGTGGDYPLTLTAANGVSPDAQQSFTLHVSFAPAITSANSTTFTVGSAGSFTVTTTGAPRPALSEAGALPSGVSFTDNGDGTATLAGTPAAGTWGDYGLTIGAANAITPNASQSFTLHVDQAPAITSANSATFTVGSAGTFTVTTNGRPTAALSESGTLPSGVTFTDNGDGTATLAGTPAAGTGGDYGLTISASNGVLPDAQQSFTLHVHQAPAITSATGTTFTVGSTGSFTVTTTGAPTPSVTESGTLPSGVTFTDNADGTATLSGTPAAGTAGDYPLSVGAANGVLPNATQSFTLHVAQQSQTITFAPLDDMTYGDDAFSVSASASSGLAVSFTASPSTVCSAGGTNGSTVSIVGVGTCAVTAHQAGNGTWSAADDVTRSFDVDQKAITVPVTPAAVQYSDPLPNLNVTGTITGLVGSDALSGTLSGCTASDLSVSAGAVQSPAGSYPLTGCTGLSNPNYAISYSGSLTVSKEAMTADYGGPTYASTGSASATKADVALSGQLTQEADGHAGDYTKAAAQFLLYNSGNLTMTSPDVTVNASVSSSGAVSATAANLPMDTYTVILRVTPSNGYFGGPAADAEMLTVFQPATGVWASGGGWLIDPSTQNIPVAVSATHPKGHFGFDVSYTKKNSTSPKGHASYSFAGADGYVYVIKSTSWQGGAFALSGAHAAYFAGKAVVIAIDPITGLAVPGIGGGNYSFRVDLTDGGSGGSDDTYALSVYTPSGALYHRVGTAPSQIAVKGGNLTVHAK
ncbi:MAG TPA: Ig-like domain-containing protein [Candidatus Limnocylindrales bacterium]